MFGALKVIKTLRKFGRHFKIINTLRNLADQTAGGGGQLVPEEEESRDCGLD
jgi:hypothetical protein